MTILHISDLHLTKIGKREKKLIEIINGVNADVLVITGDFVSNRKMVDGFIQLINKFNPRYGKFGIWGNEDYCVLNSEDRKRISKSDIVMLENEAEKIKENLWIIGVDDPVTGYDDLTKAVKGIPEDDFKILLSHSPIIDEEADQKEIDLVLAGHTHGGQIYVPLISHLIIRLHRGKGYIAGLYKVGQTYLYVTRGTGTGILPLRIFSPPEITLIKLEGLR
jgi:hypothetical protein